jgi:ankyrin repeat protein
VAITFFHILLKSIHPHQDRLKLTNSHSLIAACEKQHEHIIRFLLTHGADANAEGAKEGTALQALAEKGNIHLIELLLSHGAQINGLPGEEGNTLEYAIQSRNEAIVRYFLDRGVDVTGSFDNPEKRWESPVCKAIRYKQTDLVPLLLDKGADVNGNGPNGSALQTALNWDADGVVGILLDRGADVNKHGNYGSPLHDVIAQKKPYALVKRLLDAGADVDATVSIQGTPLMVSFVKFSYYDDD